MSNDTDPIDIIAGALTGAIFTLIIPLFKEVLQGLMMAAPQTESGNSVFLFGILINFLSVFPLLDVLVGCITAYAIAREGGLAGYILCVLGVSILFQSPEYAVSLFVVGSVMIVIAYMIQSRRKQKVSYTRRF